MREEIFGHGRLTSETRIEQLHVSTTVPRIAPLVPAPGQDVGVVAAGFRRTSLPGARHAAGYSPLVPKRLPHGFKLAGVVYAANSRATGEEGWGGNPPSHDVISLSYRRGFDQIIVTTRRTGPDPLVWFDPLHVSSAEATDSESITFIGGALAGDGGHLVVGAYEVPHIWTVGPKLVVTVAGTVDRADLLQVANSLQETP